MSDESRRQLDQAIRDYGSHEDRGEEDRNRYLTGWVLVAMAVGPNEEDGAVALVYETMPGQQWPTSVGLITAAMDHWRGGRVSEDDE